MTPIGYPMPSGSTLLQHVLDKHSQVRTFGNPNAFSMQDPPGFRELLYESLSPFPPFKRHQDVGSKLPRTLRSTGDPYREQRLTNCWARKCVYRATHAACPTHRDCQTGPNSLSRRLLPEHEASRSGRSTPTQFGDSPMEH